MNKRRKITVIGSGYVGMSLAVLFAQYNEVTIFDIDISRVKRINQKKSTVADDKIEEFLSNKKLFLSATNIQKDAYLDADFFIVATPTNYDEESNRFDTSSVDGHFVEVLVGLQHKAAELGLLYEV